MENFNDITALISGASSGIGLGVARALAAEGARVAITGTNLAKLEAASASLRDAGAKVMTLQFDVADAQAWHDAVRRTEEAMGPIQFLGLNAGIAALGKSIETSTAEDWRASWDINFMGIVNGIQAGLPGMRMRGLPAHIMVTSSLGGVMPYMNTAPYCSMKAASVTLVELLAQELEGSPISTSVMCPGAVATDFTATSNRHVQGVMPDAVAEVISASLQSTGLDPDDVGRFTLQRIKAGNLYIFPHNEGREAAVSRYEGTLAAMELGAKPGENLPGLPPRRNAAT